MVFQWFHSTAYMMDDEVGSLVEKLKPQFVTKWLKTVCDVRFDVMVMCLLPKPMEFARVRKIALKAILFATESKVLSICFIKAKDVSVVEGAVNLRSFTS